MIDVLYPVPSSDFIDFKSDKNGSLSILVLLNFLLLYKIKSTRAESVLWLVFKYIAAFENINYEKFYFLILWKLIDLFVQIKL